MQVVQTFAKRSCQRLSPSCHIMRCLAMLSHFREMTTATSPTKNTQHGAHLDVSNLHISAKLAPYYTTNRANRHARNENDPRLSQLLNHTRWQSVESYIQSLFKNRSTSRATSCSPDLCTQKKHNENDSFSSFSYIQ